MTSRQPPRSALQKAQDDLAAALKTQTKAEERAERTHEAWLRADKALGEADAVAAAYTALVNGLTPKGEALLEVGTPYIVVTPATVKTFATGKGNATKPDMRMSLYQRTGLDIRDDNQVDAWWLRALGCHLLGTPLLDLPKTHLRALDKVDYSRPAEMTT
jgi:hypothetical protein